MKNFFKKNSFEKVKGFMMVEVIIASSIMLIVTIATMTVVQKGISISHQSLHATQASFLLEEGGEAVRTIRDSDWSNISSLSTSTVYYPVFSHSTTWTARSAAEQNSWRSIAYGNGLFVAVSADGSNRVMTSPDGSFWTSRTAPNTNIWASITYGNGLFVAIACSGSNRVMTSPDGITWTARASAVETNMWRSVTYGNGLFVAVGTGAASERTDKLMTSPDGIIWTARTTPADYYISNSIAYGNGIFVAVGSNGKVITSSNGINWTFRWSSVTGNLSSIAYGNGLFVSLEGDGTGLFSSIVSSDGVTWRSRAYALQNYASFVSYGDGVFLVSDGSEILKSSADGLNWGTQTAVSGSYWTSIVYGNGFFVGVSSSGTNRVMTSYSTTTWGLSTTLSKVDSFLRTVTISNVNRDVTTGDIVSNGGVLDAGTKLITVNVSWQESGKTITKSLPFYISNIFQ